VLSWRLNVLPDGEQASRTLLSWRQGIPESSASASEFIEHPWRLWSLTGFPDGRTDRNGSFRGSRATSGKFVRNTLSRRSPSGVTIFPDTLLPTASSWRRPSGIRIADGISVISDGNWPSGIFLSGVVIINNNEIPIII
jgi:hypothetical protein